MTKYTCSNCGTGFADEQFCPQCGQWVDPLANEEYEHFDLGDAPPEEYDDQPYEPGGVATIPYAALTCPSCGSPNPDTNRHCEECGARLSQSALPVAPQPLLRTSAGVRAALMIALVLASVLALAWIFSKLGGDDPADTSSSSSSSSTTVPRTTAQITPLSWTCSSSLSPLPCDNLFDGTDNYWNDDGLEGVGATITVFFAEPIQIEQIIFTNVQDEVKFRQNFRIQDFEIEVDDSPVSIPGTLPDRPGDFVQTIQTVGTTELTIVVNSTYPAEPVGDLLPFTELALQEILFYGKPAG